MKRLLLLLAFSTWGLLNAQAQCPGALIVNEISNGPSGAKEYVELIAAATTQTGCSSSSTVDVSGWIIDDNNGIFNGGTPGSGLGISTGHLRLTTDSIWQNVTIGTLIVLFNAADFDTANVSEFSSAVSDPNGVYVTSSAIFVAVGLSPYVEKNSSTPTASSPASDAYCGAGSYTLATWTPIALRNDCDGDGIQTRCPGCTIGLSGEPSFFHGFSYGHQMGEVTAPDATFLDGAYLDIDTADTTCAANKVYALTSGTNSVAPGVSANWSSQNYTDLADNFELTIGIANSVDNAAFISAIASKEIVYGSCPQPVQSTVAPGALIVTEISNGPSGNCEYAEMIVAACGDRPDAEFVNISGWIMDDNSGNFNWSGCASGVGISTGHYRLAYNGTWDSVAVGSVIVLFNNDDNCYNLPTIYADTADANGVYWEPVGGTTSSPYNNPNIERYGSKPSSSVCTYCNTSGTTTYATASSWSSTIGFGNTGDAFQVRCPGCNDIVPGEPSFYHGIGYGAATGANRFISTPATSTTLGGPVKTFTTGFTSGAAKKIEFTGTTKADLGDDAQWTVATADASGSVPSSLGTVNATFFSAVTGNELNLPCCASEAEARMSQSTSVENALNQKMDINAYPNPANETLYITFPEATNTVVKLMDLNSRVIAEQNADHTTRVQFNVKGLTPGIYMYQVISGNDIKSGKVMIK